MCVLRVTGKNFDPAKYLASSTIKPYSVFRAGDQAEAKGRIHKVSGFKVDVSRRSWKVFAQFDYFPPELVSLARRARRWA